MWQNNSKLSDTSYVIYIWRIKSLYYDQWTGTLSFPQSGCFPIWPSVNIWVFHLKSWHTEGPTAIPATAFAALP